MWGANVAVSIAPKVVRTQRIYGNQNNGRRTTGKNGRGKGRQNAKQETFPKAWKPANQNWNRSEKLMTLELEDPLR
jgi:hypothetical protein